MNGLQLLTRSMTLVLCGVLVLTAGSGTAYAQGGTTTATITGTIVDDTGGVLPGVTVTVTNLATNQGRTMVTNEQGRYIFAGLTPGQYSLTSELAGFATFTRPQFTLNVGAVATLDVTMGVSTLQESVTVTGEAPIVERARTDLSTLISREQIESLPTNSRDFLAFTLLTPGTVENVSTTSQGIGLNVGGSRSKEAALLVDGFWNTDESFTFPRLKYSQDSIAEFQVTSLGGTAEFGRAIGGIVNAVTKSGSNGFSGSGYGFFRDKSLNALEPAARLRGETEKAEFKRQLYGGSLGGPIVRNRTFFFGSAERLDQDTPSSNNITTETAAILGLSADDVGTSQSSLEDTFAMVKVDHRLNDTHSLQAAYVMTDDVNLTLGNSFSVRSRRSRLSSLDQAFQFGWTGIARQGTWLHEARVAYFPRDYTLDQPNVGGPPLVAEGQLRESFAPSVNITRVANFGGGLVNLEMETRPVQAVYSSTVSQGRHNIKFGLDAMYVDFVYIRYRGPQTGSYNFQSLDHFLRGEYTTYSQGFGEPRIDRSHTYLSGYVQDSWTATDRLTLNYGIRYDIEWLSDYKGQEFGSDHNNVGPRFAVSYDLTGGGKTLLKMSNGLYFDRIFQNPITPSYFDNKFVGPQVGATWRFGDPGAPVYPNTFPNELPADAPLNVRDVFIVPDKFAVPASYQLVTSLDHAFSNDLAATVSFLFSKSWDKELLFDTNLQWDEASQRYFRPDPDFRRVRQYSYDGRAEYQALVLEARKRLSNKLRWSGNATIARALDQGDNFSTQVDDVRFPEREYATQVDTPRFRVVTNGSYEINRWMDVSAIFRARTGFAYDASVGPNFDPNNDGNFGDRVPGFSRNSFRMPGNHSLDLRYTLNVPIGADRRRLQVTVEAFNVYNRDNVRTVDGLWGLDPTTPNPQFGQPLTYFSPREVQLGMRFVF